MKPIRTKECKIIYEAGKVRKSTTGSRKTVDGGFVLWTGAWELFDLPAGTYTVEVTALDKDGKVVTFSIREGAAWEGRSARKEIAFTLWKSTSLPGESQCLSLIW
jgi:hypothetical protein